MNEEKNITNNKKISIGREVAIFRTLLNCTQQTFAKMLLISRATLSKLEQTEDIDSLSTDVAFRLYYITQQVINNEFKEDYVRYQAQSLHSNIDQFLQKLMKQQSL